MAADHRSALPRVPGISWWLAAVVAIAFTAIGVAYDSAAGDDGLSGVFAACYVLGCLLAVVAVRQSGVFTAVIQPPLILFAAVPLAYFLFHGSTYTSLKDTLINCGYPLIERFPLMFFTTAVVLLIGMVRWYLGAAARRAAPPVATEGDAMVEPSDDVAETESPPAAPRRSSRRSTTRATRAAESAAAAAAMETDDDDAPRPPRKSTRTSTTTTGGQRSAAPDAGSRRSRHARPSDAEVDEPVPTRPRRRNAPPVDPPAEPRRRTPTGETRQPRRETRDRDPRDRRPPVDRRSPSDRLDRAERPDRAQRRERPDVQERAERPPRRPRPADYEPPATSRTNGSGTHHPVSRVRYRSTDEGESRIEQRTRSRPSRHAAPDSWEYDG